MDLSQESSMTAANSTSIATADGCLNSFNTITCFGHVLNITCAKTVGGHHSR